MLKEQTILIDILFQINRPLGRPRREREDNINMDLQEGECLGFGLDQAGSG